MDKTQEAAHTPGPWQTEGFEAVHGNGNFYGGLIVGQDDVIVAQFVMPHNARLIASAPELLEALQAIKKIFDKDVTFIGGGPQSRVEVPFESHDQSWNHWHEARDLIRAAIAKATGAAAPAAPSLALTAFIQDVEAAEGKASGAAA